MIMQTFKRWLNKLFSWWPWKSPATIDQAHASSSAGWNTVPEAIWRSSINETASTTPQTGATSIAIEQDTENMHPGTPSIKHTGGEEADTPSQSSESDGNALSGRPSILSRQPSASTIKQPVEDSSGTENHLQFLRYLVQRGLINEGFKEGQVPEQYRKEEDRGDS